MVENFAQVPVKCLQLFYDQTFTPYLIIFCSLLTCTKDVEQRIRNDRRIYIYISVDPRVIVRSGGLCQ